MTAAQRTAAIANITAIFQQHAPPPGAVVLVNPKTQGTLYELWTLSRIVRCLRLLEALQIALVGGNNIHFRVKGGTVNRHRSMFEVRKQGTLIGELMTNVQFLTMSYRERKRRNLPPAKPPYSNYHELDIAMLSPGIPHARRPRHDQVIFGAECKDRSMSKEFVRNMLGLRRELSMYRGTPAFPNPKLAVFPRRRYSNLPASAVMLYFNHWKVRKYRPIGDIFDVDLRYLRMP